MVINLIEIITPFKVSPGDEGGGGGEIRKQDFSCSRKSHLSVGGDYYYYNIVVIAITAIIIKVLVAAINVSPVYPSLWY